MMLLDDGGDPQHGGRSRFMVDYTRYIRISVHHRDGKGRGRPTVESQDDGRLGKYSMNDVTR